MFDFVDFTASDILSLILPYHIYCAFFISDICLNGCLCIPAYFLYFDMAQHGIAGVGVTKLISPFPLSS